MKMKLMLIALLISILTVGSVTVKAYAFDHAKTKGQHLDLEDKFSRKVQLIMSNQEELGISDEQVSKIEELKMKIEKDLIRKNAEIEILALDEKAEMRKDPIDISAINKLIDKKYDLKKEKTKSLVEACAALKGILTKEQKEKMKALWKKCEKPEMQGSMGGGKMKCPMMGDKM